MTAPTPLPQNPCTGREQWLHERYRAAYLMTIMRQVKSEKMTGQVVLNVSQGTVTGLEVRCKVQGTNPV